MKVAVVGSTGMVGGVMLKVLEERLGDQVDQLLPVASASSIGKTVSFLGKDIAVIGMAEAVQTKPDIALFSAGGGTSLEWAPKFAAAGTIVIDNSSAWRMDETKLLVVPEINGKLLASTDFSKGGIIANPNCSTDPIGNGARAIARPLFRAARSGEHVPERYRYRHEGREAVGG
jgi:aspartate-semialdehyde dehydrogenase